jgi:acetylornithine deacetylase/succinyl-diaminopimelate desuccinylase-like protein
VSDQPEPEFLDPLLELLRIPSVSTGEVDPEPLQRAAEFVADFVRGAGGDTDLVVPEGVKCNPLVIGWLPANAPGAPSEPATVMAYGHYDVQGPEPLDEWETPPFEPTIKDGRIYARGASDDKGNFWPLLYEACAMYQEKALPCNVRLVVEGEEEAGSEGIFAYLNDYDEPCAACIIYDSGSIGKPTITIGARGVIHGRVKVEVADQDLHSGVFGGVALNALHVLTDALQPLRHGPDGRLPDSLRRGITPIPDAERDLWKTMPPGDLVVAAGGARPIHETSGDRYYEMTGWEPSLDINEIKAGDPRTVIPARASAFISMRVAPGQDNRAMQKEIERLVSEAMPEGGEVSFKWLGGVDAAGFDPDHPVIRAAQRAYTEAFNDEPALWRLGGTLPLLAVLERKGIGTVLTGFALAGDKIHAPNESYALESLSQGRIAARALLEELATLR